MIVYRLLRKVHRDALSGVGAQAASGRWNSRGIPMVYTSPSRALCTAEVAVSLPLGIVPLDFDIITISIPDDIEVQEINPETLPPRWRLLPFDHKTQLIGDKFIVEGLYLVMKVPSAVIPGEFNHLINPKHQEIRLVEVIRREPYEFDERFFNR